MLIRRRPALLASLLGLAFLAACTDVSPGEPRSATSELSTTTSSPQAGDNDDELPFAGAPAVSDPLDTSRYEQDPCQSFTAGQLQSLNLPTTGTPEKAPLSVGCSWRNATTRGYIGIFFFVDDPRGLSPEYEANESGKFDYFEELPDIEGYPAVGRDIADDRDNGYCAVVVGVADDMAFETNVQLSQDNIDQKDPCETAVQVAGLALRTMKGE